MMKLRHSRTRLGASEFKKTSQIEMRVTRVVCSAWSGSSWLRNVEVLANLADQDITNFIMARHRGLAPVRKLPPDGMSSAFTQKFASMLLEMAQKRLPLHAEIATSS